MQEEDKDDQDPILKFLSTAELEEMQSMPGCSKKKAEQVIAMRPFNDWDDLVSRN